jgi:hypothetical protein
MLTSRRGARGMLLLLMSLCVNPVV